jgi:hypothetical protein
MGAGNADKSFTPWKLDWIDQVICDTNLTPAERLVLIFIGQCVNQHTLDAKPGLQYIADMLGTSKGAVIRCIERGIAVGHLEVTSGTPGRPGRGHSNRYRMLGKGINGVPFKARQRDSARYPSGQQKGLNCDPERDSKTVEKGLTLSPEHLQHLNKHLFKSALTRTDDEKVDDAADEEIQTVEKGSADCSPEGGQPTNGSGFLAAMDAIQRDYDGGLIDQAEARQRLKNITRGLSATSQQPPTERPASGSPEEAKSIAPPSNVVPLPRRREGFRPRRSKRTAAEPKMVRGSRLPADWQPTDADADFARSILNYSGARIEADKFRDYWCARPGTGGVKLDWAATWRNWVRRAAELKGISPEPPQPKRPPPP